MHRRDAPILALQWVIVAFYAILVGMARRTHRLFRNAPQSARAVAFALYAVPLVLAGWDWYFVLWRW